MLTLTKRTDYALIAIRHISFLKQGGLSNTKEIASAYHIPSELLAKILQRLVKKALLMSVSGPKGGYHLAKGLSEVRVGEVVRAIEGEVRITRCYEKGIIPCSQMDRCTVRTPLERIQASIIRLLDSMTLEELMNEKPLSIGRQAAPESPVDLYRDFK